MVRVSLGGEQARIVLTNAFGAGAIEVGAATIGLAGDSAAAAVTGLRKLTFGGKEGTLIAPGANAISDPVDMPVEPLARLAVSLFLPCDTPVSTVHWHAGNVSVIGQGDQTAATQLNVESTTMTRIFLSQVLVHTRSAGTVVIIGDSLTDSTGDDEGHDTRWSDFLAERLVPARVSVVNAGISGNRLLSDGIGGAALSRVGRELLALPGTRTAIVLIGINDIVFPGSPFAPREPRLPAEALIAGYQQLIAQAHVNGIRVVGATLLPFEGSEHYTSDKDETRIAVNRWIRTGGAFDAVVDLDLAVRDPRHPSRLRVDADSGDHAHPNAVGHRLMAQAVDVQALAADHAMAAGLGSTSAAPPAAA
ncbi:SGNH/GDSL hydrolase family protein [Sorangium sp. So ce1151]|uniref:SGNH/GDSL hydrolase family protein n=1 Tax=Sorangium sp. So ce1151 TaxID=3133332 RepID=UPI003F639F2B